jgi:hypothetical protein
MRRGQAEPRPRNIDGADLAAQSGGNGGDLVATIPHLLQLLAAVGRPAEAPRLNIAKLCKNLRSGASFYLGKTRVVPGGRGFLWRCQLAG